MGTTKGSTRDALLGVIRTQLGLESLAIDWMRIIVTGQSMAHKPLPYELGRKALSFIGDSIVEIALRRWYNTIGHARGLDPTWVDYATTNERMAQYLEHLGVANLARKLTCSSRNVRKADHALGTTFECVLAVLEREFGHAAAVQYVIDRYLPYILTTAPAATAHSTNHGTVASQPNVKPAIEAEILPIMLSGRRLHPWAALLIFARQHGYAPPLIRNKRRGGRGSHHATYHCTASLNGCCVRRTSHDSSHARHLALTGLLAEIKALG